MGLLVVLSILATVYLFLQLYYAYHWGQIPEQKIPDQFTPTTPFSVVVIARNEENSIVQCLNGILHQQYPASLFEIIVINDRSVDNTVEKINALQAPNLRIYHLQDYPDYIYPPAYKKSAITLAVSLAHHDWIVLTDADCIPSPQWLLSLSYACTQNEAIFLAAPVRYVNADSWLEKMQEMEMSVLMLITGAGIHSGLHAMANGANMIFSKQAFFDVEGYDGNFQYASGDDMFLVEKMITSFPGKISFVKSKNAIVETTPKKDWTSLLKQRLRWAGKNKGLRSPVIRTIWFFVGMYHLVIFLSLGLALFQIISWWPLITLISFKWIGDFILIRQASTLFKKKSLLIYFIPLQVMYSFYIVRLGLGMLGGKKSDW